jgi:hypothetical protein
MLKNSDGGEKQHPPHCPLSLLTCIALTNLLTFFYEKVKIHVVIWLFHKPVELRVLVGNSAAK